MKPGPNLGLNHSYRKQDYTGTKLDYNYGQK